MRKCVTVCTYANATVCAHCVPQLQIITGNEKLYLFK